MALNRFVLSVCRPTTTASRMNCSQVVRFVLFLAVMSCALFRPPSALGQFLINSPTPQWRPIQFGTNGTYDATNDQQVGSSELDIVGNAYNPSLYMRYDNGGLPNPTAGWLGFRLRLGADVSPPGYKGVAFVGVDANLDGKLDLVIGVDNQGSSDSIGIWYPGTGLNTSPNTTTLANSPLYSYAETSANYSFAPVTSITDPTATSFDLNGDGLTDQFLSFEVPFADVVAALDNHGFNITSSSQMKMVAWTATQVNSMNGDLNGATGGINSSLPWNQLGALSDTYLFNGTLVPAPEPSTLSCCFVGSLVLLCLQRQRFRP